MTATTNRTAELHAAMTEQLEALVTGDDWAAMLATSAHFHNYSARNILLIASQRPDATRVAGYGRWQELGRQVRKGEKGIAILAPCVSRTTVDTDDGGEATIARVRGFRVAHVFDIAQTDGPDIADVRPTLLEGEAPVGLWDGLAEAVALAGFTLERGDCGGANGWTVWADKTVRVRADVSDAQAAKTLAHELGHVLLHESGDECRGVKEVEAESVAYIVTQAAGMVTTDYSLPYVARWANGDLDLVAKTAGRVVACAHAILETLAVADVREAVAA